jgi:hypothetical protein
MRRTQLFLLLLLLTTTILGLAGTAGADTCTCDIFVYSEYRWMDPWWGLECNNHCGHGYVGSSCDSLHGTGCGAMTGFVRIRHSNGATLTNFDCPDNHFTCFRGPSACDDGGSWGNTCSADIQHCTAGGQGGDGTFDCNALSDSFSTFQSYALDATFAGACGTNWFNVLEFINENDPTCCDDPMGHINVSTWTAEGSTSTYLAGGDQNCNGGSQGGVYPHCGSFGATLRVDSNCFTTVGGGGGGGGGGEEEPPPPAAATLAARLPAGIEAQRLALADSLDRRERALAATSRTVVEGEVTARALLLGVKAPVAALTDLLEESATAELARDRCQTERSLDAAAACRPLERRLAGLDASFRKLSGGLTVGEFRSGSTLTGPPPAPAPPELKRSQP